MSLRSAYLARLSAATDEWVTSAALSDVVHELVADGAQDVDDWLDLARDESISDLAALGAFVGATTVCRRKRNFMCFKDTVEEDALRKRFASSTVAGVRAGYRLSTAESQMYRLRMGQVQAGTIDDALATVRTAGSDFTNHHGTQNLIVELCLTALDANPQRQDLIKEAEIANARSIDLEPRRAKYWAHRGLIRAYQGRYHEARCSVEEAIDREDANRWDYSAMIADHKIRLAQILAIKVRSEIGKEFEEFQGEIADSRGQLLTLTGLLAAVVAIVIVNAGIASSFDNIHDAFALTFAGTGAVAVTFASPIALVLTPRRRSQWVVLAIVVALGLALMIVGFTVAT